MKQPPVGGVYVQEDAHCLPSGLPDPTPHSLVNTSNPQAARILNVSSHTVCENTEIKVALAALDDSDSAQSQNDNLVRVRTGPAVRVADRLD